MGLIKKIFGFLSKNEPNEEQKTYANFGYKADGTPQVEANWSISNSWRPNMERRFWNGEKNWGEGGTIYNYTADYYSLAARCWQAYTENDSAALIVNDYVRWAIGTGLRLEAQPCREVLNAEGVALSENRISELSELTEKYFDLHSKCRYSSYSRTSSIQKIAKEAMKTAALSGDCLIIQRIFEKGGLNAELIDGMRVVQPLVGSKFHAEALRRGNVIINGIETNSRGGHVAFYVRSAATESSELGFNVKRIPAKATKTGRTQAFMVYHSRYRVGYNRGIPLLSPILEKLGKLDRYIEAAVGSAEERAKIVYFIKHEMNSTGESPLTNNVKISAGIAGHGAKDQDQNIGINSQDANWIASTSGKQTYNLTQGSELKALESKAEVQFEDFSRAVFDIILASVGAPPEVFRKQFNSNYSASRMAVKTWGYTLKVIRDDFSFYFYLPIYATFFEYLVLRGKISAPGYLDALFDRNAMIIEAYRKARFIGDNVPDVDPVKEVRAARERMGKSAENVPLSTPEQETEALGFGEFSENKKKFKRQIKDFDGDI